MTFICFRFSTTVEIVDIEEAKRCSCVHVRMYSIHVCSCVHVRMYSIHVRMSVHFSSILILIVF